MKQPTSGGAVTAVTNCGANQKFPLPAMGARLTVFGGLAGG